MDRPTSNGHSDWHSYQNHQPPSPATYTHQYLPPTAQPLPHFSFADPFQANRDPFLHQSQYRNENGGPPLRAWHSSQGYSMSNGHSHLTPSPSQSHALPPPPPPPNGLAPMSLPYDPSRRKSPAANGSPLQHPHGTFEPPPPPPFQLRQMPPPSPPQIPSSASSLPGSAPRGPPTASPFAGIRDIASYSSNRPSGGMSISSILDANDSKKSHGSPLTSTPKSMPPPSPGRARSSSMREGYARGARDVSPPRSMYREPKTAPQAMGHDRTVSEPRRDGLFASPQFGREPLNNFRAFQPPQQESRVGMNGHGPPARPSSQPSEPAALRRMEDVVHRDALVDGRMGGFRPFVESRDQTAQSEAMQQHAMARNGYGPAPPLEHAAFPSPQLDRERAQQGLGLYQSGAFGTPMREEQTGSFRPAYPPAAEPPRESIEMRQYYDAPRSMNRSSPPISEYPSYDRGRNSFADRPMTFEDHRRMEALQQRKESDGSLHRAILNISPEASRNARNSPLPQAVQGAQPRHIGGGGNPGVKMEFGRMFSGLGSGVGTATPTAGHANGTMTPTRMTPVRQVEGGELIRTAVDQIEGSRRSSKGESRGGRKNNRRSRDDEERMNGRETPDNQRGNKRAKTNHTSHHHHHHHAHSNHHHHHHQQPPENSMPNPFNTIRFQSNQLTHSNLLANNAPHHHHHHHATHAHPGHHHHHAPRAAAALPPRKPTTTVTSKRVIEECSKRPRKHLGSQLYTTETSPSTTGVRIGPSSRSKPIPNFTGKENCMFTVRVPRWYLTSTSNSGHANYLEEICRRRQLWGTDIYTDDSDVIAAAVHSGWLKGDLGEFNDDLREICDNDSEREDDRHDNEDASPSLVEGPKRPVKPPEGFDAHITVLILPGLVEYKGICRHHLWSRDWGGKKEGVMHDGMSFMIHSVEFVKEGTEAGRVERTARGRKERMRREGQRRKDAAKGLVLFAGGEGAGGVIDVKA